MTPEELSEKVAGHEATLSQMNERLGSIDARLTAMDGRMATTGELRARMGLVSALIAAWEQSGFSDPESPKLDRSLKPSTLWSRFADTPWRQQREWRWPRALLLWHSGVREHEDGICPVNLWCVWLTLGA
jgi:hypothetical protein